MKLLLSNLFALLASVHSQCLVACVDDCLGALAAAGAPECSFLVNLGCALKLRLHFT